MLQMPRMHGGQSSPEPSSPEPSSPEACSPEPSSPEATSPEPSSPEATSPEPASEHEQWSSRRRGACGAGRADRQRREKGASRAARRGEGRAARRAPPRTQTGSPSAPRAPSALCTASKSGRSVGSRARARRLRRGRRRGQLRRGDGGRPADLQVHVADDLVLLVVALDDGTESPRRGFLVALPRARREPVRVLGQVPGSRVGPLAGHAGRLTCSVARKAPRKRVAPTTATIAGPRPNIAKGGARASRSDHSKRGGAFGCPKRLGQRNGCLGWVCMECVRTCPDFAAVRKSGRMSGRGSMSR